MLKSPYQPCIPTAGAAVPATDAWVHEVKHDGYRLIVMRDGNAVHLFTRNGHDWSKRFPLITEAALRNRCQRFVLDGEAVLLGIDGRSDFNGLHSRRHDAEVELYAFDILVLEGTICESCLYIAKDQSRPDPRAQYRRHPPCTFRAGRDRPRPLSPRMSDGIGGPGLQAPRPPLSRWPLKRLGQGQKSGAPGNGPEAGRPPMTASAAVPARA
ncbi:hypothetical protein JQ586_39010 [Bradyrhizobium jicamae]|nr:hypothetical protein [Bradyrhizobium jicamae]